MLDLSLVKLHLKEGKKKVQKGKKKRKLGQ